MRRAQADDPAVPLDDALRVPRHVVRDNALRLLEVLALGQHVGGQQQAHLATLRLVAGAHDRVGGKPSQRLRPLVGRGLLTDHRDAVAPGERGQVLIEIADRRAERREHGDLLGWRRLDQVTQEGKLGVGVVAQRGEDVSHRGQPCSVGGHVSDIPRIKFGHCARPGVDLKCLLDPPGHARVIELCARGVAQRLA